jgi:gliding motility-associated-like protein
MSYPAPNRLYFVTSSGGVYLSSDQGTTNDILFSDPRAGVIYNIATYGTNRIYALGWRSAQATEKTVLFRSFNNGLSWDTVKTFPTGANAPLCQGIRFATQDTGYISGSKGKVFRTTDGGFTWVDISPFPALNASSSFNAINIADKNTIFVGSFIGGLVYKSTDAGATWKDVSLNITNQFAGTLNDLLVHDSSNVYGIMNNGRVVVTSNGGTSWSVQHAPSDVIFTSGAFVPRQVPAGTPISNRKTFIAGASAQIMEYGNVNTINLSSTETIVNTTCTTVNGGTITITPVGGIPPYSYSINGGTFQTSNIFSGLAQGAKIIVIKDAGCQSITKTITVGFTDNLTLTKSNDTTVCSGAPVQLFATSAATTYLWTPATGLSNAAIANPIATPTAITTYTVTATLGACTKTGNVIITIKPSPTVSAGPDQTIIGGNQVTLTGSASNAASIAWTPASSLSNANTLTPTASPTATTTYTLTVKTTDNCTSTDDVVVNVIPYCVQVMNAFTPNGDGMNDKWRVTNGSACTNQVSVSVYNRYGRAVYKNSNYNNDWDGTYEGKPLPDATYYYRVTLRLINDTIVNIDGDVTILR